MTKSLIQLHDTNPEEFKNSIVAAIFKRLDLIENKLPIQRSEWITRKEASSLLGVSLVTIHDWTKKDILKAYRIGNRVRFKLQEIEQVLNSSRNES